MLFPGAVKEEEKAKKEKEKEVTGVTPGLLMDLGKAQVTMP